MKTEKAKKEILYLDFDFHIHIELEKKNPDYVRGVLECVLGILRRDGEVVVTSTKLPTVSARITNMSDLKQFWKGLNEFAAVRKIKFVVKDKRVRIMKLVPKKKPKA